jgi:hypothetical protein
MDDEHLYPLKVEQVRLWNEVKLIEMIVNEMKRNEEKQRLACQDFRTISSSDLLAYSRAQII